MKNEELIYNSVCKGCGVVAPENKQVGKEYPILEQDVCGDGPTLLARLVLCLNCLTKEYEQSRENT